MQDSNQDPTRDPDNYIWGIFYANRDDKRLFPPKYHPWLGFTVNFGQPKSILAMVTFAGLCFGCLYVFGLIR